MSHHTNQNTVPDTDLQTRDAFLADVNGTNMVMITVSDLPNDDPIDRQCAICLGSFTQEAEEAQANNVSAPAIIRLPCGHSLHRTCLITWLDPSNPEAVDGGDPAAGVGSNSCPFCRRVLFAKVEQQEEGEEDNSPAIPAADVHFVNTLNYMADDFSSIPGATDQQWSYAFNPANPDNVVRAWVTICRRAEFYGQTVPEPSVDAYRLLFVDYLLDSLAEEPEQFDGMVMGALEMERRDLVEALRGSGREWPRVMTEGGLLASYEEEEEFESESEYEA
ncbi:hypothetical protein K402DRAFT_408087 [Aulographum hederae CBS 113979]|uniref:RING-type domain-containing protein n=1 Tax=Aulographum hederae CBS 113979 TaxID=1176131 RepID=A0A6G1GLR0_9PEZI|nr:hypothetical protein K402DRAFT_408087 [Aulographum hederae CBS 113979]